MKLSFLILFFLALSGTGESTEQNPMLLTPSVPSGNAATDDKNKVEKRQGPQTPEASVFDKIVSDFADYEKARHEQNRADEKRWWPPSSNWAIVYATILYVIVAIVAACIALRTLKAIETQANAAVNQAAAARDTAEATRINVQITRDQLQAVRDRERAWIMVKPNPIAEDAFPNTGSQYPFKFEFGWTAKNVGYTAGFLVKLRVKTDILDYPLPDKRPEFKESRDFAKFIIPPNGEHGSVSGKTVEKTDFDDIERGNKCIAFFGFIDYRDIFSAQDSEPHHTYFCAYWHIDKQRGRIFEPVGPADWVDYT